MARKLSYHLTRHENVQVNLATLSLAFQNGAVLTEVMFNPSNMEKMVHFQLYLTSKKAGLNRMRRTGEGGIVAKGAYDEPDPRKIMAMVSEVSDEKILDRFQFISSADEVIEIIESFRKVGATRVNVCTHSYPDRIRYLGRKVRPYFNRKQQK